MRTSPTISRTGRPGPVGRVPAAAERQETHAARGFTLTEILVIVALIGMLASASGNAVYGTYKRYLVEKAARQLYLAARYARLFAVEQHTHCRLILDKTNRRFFIMIDRPDASTEEAATRIIANSCTKPTVFGGEVAFEDVKVLSAYEGRVEGVKDGAVITFYPDGTADMSTVQIGDGLNHFSVYVAAATGKAQVQFGEAVEATMEIIDLDMEGF